MKKLLSLALLLTFSATALGATVADAPQIYGSDANLSHASSTGRFVPDEILVRFQGDNMPFRVIKVPYNEVLEQVKLFKRLQHVVFAEPNYIVEHFWTPNDPLYVYQWNFDNPVYGGVEAEDAWGALGGPGSPGAGATVAVVDTGVAYEDYAKGAKRYYRAPDFSGACFVPGYDFVENDSHPNDDNSHGTHVAATIIESTNNSVGAAGLAFRSCLMPVKALDRNGAGTVSNVANGIRFAADSGADVINLSLGGPSPSSALEDAVNYAYGKGALVVAASGNEGSSQVGYPAAYTNVLAVGATRYDETRPSYSNYGTALDIVAPGGDLSVNQNGDGYSDGILQQTFNPNTRNTSDFGYWFMQGTSMATPHVSAVAAMLIANGNAHDPSDVRAALIETADDLGVSGWDSQYGHGLVNAAAALQWSTTTSPTPDPDPESDPEPEPAPTMHIGDITMSYESRGPRCRVSAQVPVIDESGTGVANAVVSGAWSGSYTGNQSDNSNSSGVAEFQTSWVRNCASFTFTVDNVSKDGYIFDPDGSFGLSKTIIIQSSAFRR